jgi:pyruvate/2-oxoglutarate dehydrogenase complex dihydrolipoamide acyltransferase (E2) component
MAPMIGLVDVDVTKARRLLASHEPPSSMTAFVVASVARAAAAHPGVHAYRNWRGQLVTHRHVDVTTMVEIPTPQGPFGLPHVLRDAEVRDVLDLTLVIDHNVVDGAPATRFAAQLRELIESAAVMSPAAPRLR